MRAIQRLISSVLFLYFAVTVICLPFVFGYLHYTEQLFLQKELINTILVISTKLFLLFLALQTLIPFPILIRMLLAGYPNRQKLKSNHWIYQSVKATAKKMNMRTPHVYIVADNSPNAFAFSTLFSSVTCVTTGLIEITDEEELAWVMAHELSHIRNKDSLSHGWYIAAMKTIEAFFNLTSRAVNLVVNSISSVLNALLPSALSYGIATLLIALLNLVFTLQVRIIRISRFAFDVIDRSIDREMEFRCDKEAAIVYGGDAGVRILLKLTNGIEPTFGDLMASHPPNKKRISAIKNIKAKGKL